MSEYSKGTVVFIVRSEGRILGVYASEAVAKELAQALRQVNKTVPLEVSAHIVFEEVRD